jgi:ribosome-binding protein aMBF1 (putative translation factor)
MKLKEYISQYMVKNKQLANRLEIDPSTLCKIVFGQMQPKLKTAILIEKITEGKVTVYDWEDQQTVACEKEKKTIKEKVKSKAATKRKKTVRNS